MRNSSFQALFLVLILIPCRLLWAQEARPPRVEIGPVLSSVKRNQFGDFHAGGGGRVTFNVNRILGAEFESTRNPADSFDGDEIHTSVAAKITYRKEGARGLKFAGLNFFGVAGLGFLNRAVSLPAPLLPGCACLPTASERQTKSIFDYGGGVEVVPARFVSIRFDLTGANFYVPGPYNKGGEDRTRVFIKTAIMFRFK